MSRSKFAIKRIKERQNNPEIWDAAYELAEEWNTDVNKITYDDAEWRVLNKMWISAWSACNLDQVNALAFQMLISCVKTKQYKAALPMIPFVIYGHYINQIEWAEKINGMDPFAEDFPYPEFTYIAQAARSKEAVKDAFFFPRTKELLEVWAEETGVSTDKVWLAFEKYLDRKWARVANDFSI